MKRLHKRFRSPGPGAAGLALAVILLQILPLPEEGSAQGSTPGPDSVAAEFQAAVRGVGWRAAVARLHPEALADFHYRMTLLVEMDTTRAPLEKLFPEGGLDAYHGTSAEGVFLRVMDVLSEDAPGLVHALVVRDVEIIGSVAEGPDVAHVVYRSTAQLSGALPEMRLMTMKKDEDRWRVLSSQELDILVEAFRGISRRRAPPPGGWPGGIDPDTTRSGPQTPRGPPGRSGSRPGSGPMPDQTRHVMEKGPANRRREALAPRPWPHASLIRPPLTCGTLELVGEPGPEL